MVSRVGRVFCWLLCCGSDNWIHVSPLKRAWASFGWHWPLKGSLVCCPSSRHTTKRYSATAIVKQCFCTQRSQCKWVVLWWHIQQGIGTETGRNLWHCLFTLSALPITLARFGSLMVFDLQSEKKFIGKAGEKWGRSCVHSDLCGNNKIKR